jgi:hypothetical protein
MKQSWTKFAALALAAFSLMGTAAVAQTPIKIGYLGTFSGPLAPISNDMYDAFMLVVKKNGGKLGGVPVEIIKEDDQFKPDVGLQAVQKLIEKERTVLPVSVHHLLAERQLRRSRWKVRSGQGLQKDGSCDVELPSRQRRSARLQEVLQGHDR